MIFSIISGVIALIAIGLCIWNHTRIKKLERQQDIILNTPSDRTYGDSFYGST